MNVLMINVSPHQNGFTYTALSEVAKQLEANGIETNIVHIGGRPIQGCSACGGCDDTPYCVFKDDRVNECIDLMKKADGLVVGSPVYYAAPNGSLCAFPDRSAAGGPGGDKLHSLKRFVNGHCLERYRIWKNS